jgi:hypothetical protein
MATKKAKMKEAARRRSPEVLAAIRHPGAGRMGGRGRHARRAKEDFS